jgi:hypothetical protein
MTPRFPAARLWQQYRCRITITAFPAERVRALSGREPTNGGAFTPEIEAKIN